MNLPQKILVLDIETDGLKPTVIWCCAASNGEVYYDAISFNTFIRDLDTETTLVAHNGLAYDFPVLERLWGADLSIFPKLDTLILSRLANPSREGGHGLKAWGVELGFPKGDYNDWSHLNDEMVTYCKQDVAVNVKVLEKLRVELAHFKGDCVDLEHEVQSVIIDQINNGWQLDERYAYDLVATLKERVYELEAEVHAVFLPLPTFISEVTPKVKKDGTISVVGLKFLGDSWVDVGGRFSRVDYPIFNLGSRQQIGRWLQHFGWEPEVFTDKGQPKVDETVLVSVTDIPQAQLISEYLTVQKRIALVSSWIAAVDSDTGRVHGYVNSNGAVTGRMTHSKPNVAQVPSSHSPYGVESRSCWIASEGYSLVGMDASGLELRMLAHYMNDAKYTSEILDGDIHTANMIAAGLTDRSQAKTFIYAYLYGAGDEKIGSIVGGGRAEGATLKAKFLENTPALAVLRVDVEKQAIKGNIEGLDGRRLMIRSSHAALNTLLQSAGAIVMKKALTLLDHYAKLWGIKYRFVGNIHDEIQTEVEIGKEDVFGRLAVSCIQAAGTHFNLNCPLDGEYKVGSSWASTH
jgi:DNA polymerase I-like protein with 3'-5' exonuclease and polymerase domains